LARLPDRTGKYRIPGGLDEARWALSIKYQGYVQP
jgi:hypothetical protein